MDNLINTEGLQIDCSDFNYIGENLAVDCEDNADRV
jgi:hypothetical protein